MTFHSRLSMSDNADVTLYSDFEWCSVEPSTGVRIVRVPFVSGGVQKHQSTGISDGQLGTTQAH